MNQTNIRRVKLHIAGQVYRLNVPPYEEEQVRTAADLINERMQFYQKTMGTSPYDSLCMALLDTTVRELKLKAERTDT